MWAHWRSRNSLLLTLFALLSTDVLTESRRPLSNDTRKTSTVISPTRDSKYFGQKASMRGIHFGRSVSVHAEVTSMSAQFIISRPLTPPVYWGPRIKKAHSEHTEKGKRSAVRALNIQLDKGGRTEARWSCVPVLHVTLLISCLTDYIQLNGFKCCCVKTGERFRARRRDENALPLHTLAMFYTKSCMCRLPA